MCGIFYRSFIIAVIAITFMALSACKEFFHSKEDINYTNLTIGAEHNGSIEKNKKNYYMFDAEQSERYNIDLVYLYTYRKGVDVTVFCYDTEAVLLHGHEVDNNERNKNGEWIVSNGGTFTASRSGRVVVRIIGGDNNSVDYTIKVIKH